jgi:hypothetical protein
VVKCTRWSPDEWRLVQLKARQLKLTVSEYVRAKTLDTPPWLIARTKAAKLRNAA